jgi:uncharacterized protein (TIGR02996 family)
MSAGPSCIEEQRLLAAIAAAPEDDGPRLVYADWLQQRGDPRGDLIAVQCVLATRRAGLARPVDPAMRALVVSERDLLQRHEAEWLAAIGLGLGEATLERGLVERVDTTAPRAAAAIDRIAGLPGLRALRIAVGPTGNADDLAAIAVRLRGPLQRALGHVTIDRRAQWDATHCDEVERSGDRLTVRLDTPARALAAVAAFEGLLARPPPPEAIAVELCGRGRVDIDELFQRLIAGAARPPLRALSVRFANGVARDLVQWIACRTVGEVLARYPALEALTLPMAELWLDEIHHPRLTQLQLGWLGDVPFGPADTAVWGTAPAPRASGLTFLRGGRLPALEQLAIDFQYDWYVGWQPEDIAALCAARGLPRLRSLTLRYGLLGDELCHRLPDAPFAPQLEQIDLTATEVSETGARHLVARRSAFPRLRRLVCMRFDEVSAATWAALAAAYPVAQPS